MAEEPQALRGDLGGVPWEVRPEWLAGRHWWRIYIAGHPKVLVRYREYARIAAEALAGDEASFRREAGGAEV